MTVSSGQLLKPRAQTLGLMLAFAAAISSAGFVVPYKQASMVASPSVTAFALLFVAAVLNSLMHLGRRGLVLRDQGENSRFALWTGAVILAVLAVVGNCCSALALEVLGPATVSAVLRSEVLVVGTMSVWLLGERPSRLLWLGASVALLGLLLLKGEGLTTPNAIGVGHAVVAAICFSGMQVTARKVAKRVNPVELNSVRLWLSCALLAAWPANWRDSIAVPLAFWVNVTLAALFGPVLSRMLLMYAVRYITAGMCTLVMLVAPLFALALGAVVLHQLPTSYELWGATLMLVGIGLPMIELHASVRRNAP